MTPSLSTPWPNKPFRRGVYSATLAVSLSVIWPAWAATPFTVNGNGTVTDASTSLVWDQCPYGLTGAACDTGTVFFGDWPTALTKPVEANAASYKGYTDWRVPNKNELQSIAKRDTYTPGQPDIDTTAFPGTPLESFWTSTTFALHLSYAWIVVFGSGGTGAEYKASSNYVRLVRSGQSLASADLLDAPVTTAAPTISSTPTSTTAGISVTINEAGTGYWLLLLSTADAPTSAQVVAGVNYGAVSVVASGSMPMSAATPAGISLSGLMPGTAYKLYFVAKDTANNLQAAVGSVAVTTAATDTTPPITTAGPSISSGPTGRTAGISVTINEAGTGYWLLVPGAATAPTSTQVVAGVNYAGVTGCDSK